MNFQDNEKNSVQSLLALLRSTQDGPTPNPLRPGPIATPVSSGSGSNGATGQGVKVPSSSELNTLLRSLNPPPAPSTPTRPAGPSTKGSRNLIEPFGPVKDFTSPSAERKGSAENLRRGNSGDTGRLSSANVQEAVEGRDGDKGAQDMDMGIIPFVKCLPRLSELMGDEKFMLELRKMKADQDALERRLWAKEEKLEAEHERSLQAEKDIARIAQRPISADKRAQWAANLDLSLQDFHLQTCLPSLDSLSRRHRERLGSLGVPGLGGDVAAEGTVERWRRIMDLLQAGLE